MTRESGEPGQNDPAVDPQAQGSPGSTPIEAGRAAQLRTFLIVDIRGYTTYTREHGDDAAAALASQFATLVAAVVAAREGYLLELRGDEALVVFVSARQALRAAVDIQDRVRTQLPRQVGIGLDAGEAIAVEGGYRGTALNLAARLSSQARPGEVLASEAVIHMAAHVDGLSYLDPRSYRLKGFDEPIRAVAVVPEALAPRGFERTLRRARRRMFRDRRLPVALLALVVVFALAGTAMSGALDHKAAPSDIPEINATPTPTSSPDLLASSRLPVVAFIDPSTGMPSTALSLATPTDLSTFVDGSFWVLAVKPKALYRIDPVSHTVAQTITVPVEADAGYAFAAGTIWITDAVQPRIIGIDARTGVKVHEFTFSDAASDTNGAGSVAVGAGSLWVARPDRDEIVRLDPSSGRITQTIKFPQPWSLAFGDDGALWVTGDGKISRVDPVTNQATLDHVTLALHDDLPYIAFGGGAAWTTDPAQGIVYRVAHDGTIKPYQTGPGAATMAFRDGTLWVANKDAGSITAIDTTTSETRTLHVGHEAVSIAAGPDDLMVGVARTPDDEMATLSGKILRVAETFDPTQNPSPDPAVNFNLDFRRLEFATCAKLVNYPDAPPPDGLDLQPEVAASMPDVSPDGRMYTFKVRSDFKFSPPSNETLTAQTFRASIERALSPAIGSDRAYGFMSDVEGATAYHGGTADHVSGLSASGDTLTIHLTARAPDFLQRLALPLYCPVPISTPAVQNGVDPDPPLPSAGPYYLAQHLDGLVILRKNPNYHGPRPQTYDVIALRVNLDAGETVARVNRGEADVAIATNDPVLMPGNDLATQWGPGSSAAAAGQQRWFAGPFPGVDYVALNGHRGLLADPTVRQAIALALDRTAVAAVFPERAVDTILRLPPTASESQPTLSGPDLAAASSLMHGRRGTVVFAVARGCSPCNAIAATVRSSLANIGLTVRIAQEDDPQAAAAAPGSKIDMEYNYAQTYYFDPALLLKYVAIEVPISWQPSGLGTELDQVLAESGAARLEGAQAIERQLLTERTVVVPFGSTDETVYVGPTAGCQLIQPAVFGLDFAALCPKPG